MTEAEWLAGTDLAGMKDLARTRASLRKMLLYAAAWCRCGGPQTSRAREAVEVAELCADGQARLSELSRVGDVLSAVLMGPGRKEDHPVYAAVLRDVLGNPFRPAAVKPGLLGWEGGTIPRLAQAIYDERAFDRMPFLGDALEEVGCTDANVLAHCHQPGAHVRGCWVVDLLLEQS